MRARFDGGAITSDDLAAVARESAAAGTPVRRFRELTYTTHESWSRTRRVVAKAEHLPTAGASGDGKANPRFVVTSLPRTGPGALDARPRYDALDGARGEMENRITEQHLLLCADRTSAATMRANPLRLACSSVAYVLMHARRRLAWDETEMAHAPCETIRRRLLKVGAQIRGTVRHGWLALATGCPAAALFARAHAILTALPRSQPMRCGRAADALRTRCRAIDRSASLSQRPAARAARRRPHRLTSGRSGAGDTQTDPRLPRGSIFSATHPAPPAPTFQCTAIPSHARQKTHRGEKCGLDDAGFSTAS